MCEEGVRMSKEARRTESFAGTLFLIVLGVCMYGYAFELPVYLTEVLPKIYLPSDPIMLRVFLESLSWLAAGIGSTVMVIGFLRIGTGEESDVLSCIHLVICFIVWIVAILGFISTRLCLFKF